jgi:hypothetical protein
MGRSATLLFLLLLFTITHVYPYHSGHIPLMINKTSSINNSSFLPLYTLQDTVVINHIKIHSPHKASVYSALIPGGGQMYNKKYWKVPLVWGGLSALSYSIVFNQREFKTYQRELDARKRSDTSSFNPDFSLYPTPFLRSSRDFHRNNRDFSIVGLVAFYVLSIVDASVDAHLITFDVNRSLSFKTKTNPSYSLHHEKLYTQVQLGLFYQF